MPIRRPKRPVTTLVLAATAALVGGLFTAPATSAEPGHASEQEPGHASEHRPLHAQAGQDRPAGPQAQVTPPAATLAFERARAIFASDDRTDVPHEATLALRELRRVEHLLSPSQRGQLARWDSTAWKAASDRPRNRRCAETATVVIHCSSRPSGFTAADARAAVATAHHTYVGAGYKAPVRDPGKPGFGPNRKVDVYLADLGTGLYGYCAGEGTYQASGGYGVNAFGYCVLNSDYGWASKPSVAAMRATVAHEYFHAVQFAYDYFEDGWFMESTAAWAEERVFDDVNDNRQFLAVSPLTRPARAMWRFGGDSFHYGGWIFWEYLAQRFGKKAGGMETIVRNTWRRSDGPHPPSFSKPHRSFSLQSLRTEISRRGTNLPSVFAGFSDANRRPARTYPEGDAPAYRRKPAAGGVTLRHPGAGKLFVSRGMRQLTGRTYVYRPQDLPGRKIRLRLRFDLPPKARASRVVVSLYRQDGSVKTRHARLGRAGDGRMVTDFSSSRIRRVEVTLANGSSVMTRCGQHWEYLPIWACEGRPRFNDGRGEVRGRVFRAS